MSPVYSHPGKIAQDTGLPDLIREIKRSSQIIYPKDSGFILMKLSVKPGQTVLVDRSFLTPVVIGAFGRGVDRQWCESTARAASTSATSSGSSTGPSDRSRASCRNSTSRSEA
mgnify:CR=1 FL=1